MSRTPSSTFQECGCPRAPGGPAAHGQAVDQRDGAQQCAGRVVARQGDGIHARQRVHGAVERLQLLRAACGTCIGRRLARRPLMNLLWTLAP